MTIMNFNKVILMGRLTRDPDLKVTANGNSICKIGLAVSRSYTTKDGEKREEATFVDVDCFGKTADTVNRFFTKGKPILVEGRLKLDQWESQAGEKRSKLSVIMESFTFVGGNDEPKQQSEPSKPTSAPQGDLEEEVPF